MSGATAEPTVQTLAQFQARISGASLEAFARRYPHPFLVEWRPRQGGGEFRGSQTAEPGAGLPGELSPDTARIVQVRKVTPVAAFKHITVGRTPNNDIPLADSGISKLHAYLVAPEPGAEDSRWRVVDVSTYGTAVNGERSPAELSTPLLRAATEAAAPRLSFAEVHFLFVEDPKAALATILGLWQRSVRR